MLAGRDILVTAGPTWAPIDRVRYIGNRSTGATGVLVAQVLRDRGARVHLVYGPGRVPPPEGVEVLPVETPHQMRQAALEVMDNHPVVAGVFAAAVLDFLPEEVHPGKTPSGTYLTVHLKPAPKLIDELVRAAPQMVAVGFKLECEVDESELISAARALIRRARLSAVVANDLARIRGEEHPALLATADGKVLHLQGKREIAQAVARHLEEILARRTLPGEGR